MQQRDAHAHVDDVSAVEPHADVDVRVDVVAVMSQQHRCANVVATVVELPAVDGDVDGHVDAVGGVANDDRRDPFPFVKL